MKFTHKVYVQSKYIQNQVVYYFGKSIYRQSRAFLGLKKFLVSTLNTVDGILCCDIMSELSKILKSLAI